MEKITLQVEGMSCGHCKAAVEKALLEIPGVQEAEVNLSAKTVAIAYDPAKTGREALVNAVTGAGYDVIG